MSLAAGTTVFVRFRFFFGPGPCLTSASVDWEFDPRLAWTSGWHGASVDRAAASQLEG